MSLALVFFAFLGFNSLAPYSGPVSQMEEVKTSSSTPQTASSPTLPLKVTSSIARSGAPTSTSSEKAVREDLSATAANARATSLKFAGLDKSGIPTGFTITDNSGALGALYFNAKDATLSETGIGLSWLVKTLNGSANLLLSQNFRQEGAEVEYDSIVSIGMNGGWVPTNSRVISANFERLVSGNYLLTAVIQVKSAIETTIVIPASASGQDLSVLPSRVVTRVVLNPSKTQVLAQAVQVIEKGTN
jgi:hypothetical protein